MSQSVRLLDLSFRAEEDLSSSQYCAVKLGTAANTVVRCGASDIPIGILQNAPTSGLEANVRVAGTSKVLAHTSFSKGEMLGPAAATGRLAAIGAAPTNTIGKALEAAAKGGVIAEMLITFGYLGDAVAPAALTAACTELSPFTFRQDGNITAAITSKMLAIPDTAGVIRAAGFWLGTTGTDSEEDLHLEMDVKINTVSIFSTQPKIAKTAADGATTFESGTGVTVGVVDEAANIVAAFDLVTVEFAIERTASPSIEMADVFGQVWMAAKVGAD